MNQFLKCFFIFVIILLPNLRTIAQCSSTGEIGGSIPFSSIINCPNLDAILTDISAHPSGGEVYFDADITINSLSITFANGTSPVLFRIPLGVTVTILNDLTLAGQPDKDKFLTVDGALIVGGTLDFGNLEFEIDGSGTMDAGDITGADDVTCSELDNDCPIVTSDSCDDGTASGEEGFCNDDVLPVELLYFNTELVDNSVKLSWATVSEENNDYFSLERSTDGMHFDLLTTVNGAGNSSVNLRYSYTDETPHYGLSYYRLSQTDYSGNTAFFDIVAVNFSTVKTLILYPNPVSKGRTLTIQTGADPEEKVNVMIYNQSGILVRNEQLKSNNDISIDELEAGSYILKIWSGHTSKSTRLMIE